jgi:hypothetical protein
VILAQEYEQIDFGINKQSIPVINKEEIVVLLNDLLLTLEVSNVSRMNLILDNLSLFSTLHEHIVFKSIVLSCKQFDFEAAQQNVKDLKEELSNG